MPPDPIRAWNAVLPPDARAVCDRLADLVDAGLPEEDRSTGVEEIDEPAVARWLDCSRDVQWDYKNIVRRKGRLERLR